MERIKPSLEAKIFGPAFIITGLILIKSRIALLNVLKRLQVVLIKPRIKKSRVRINMTHLKDVKIKVVREITVRTAFTRTTLSFTCLSDVGQHNAIYL